MAGAFWNAEYPSWLSARTHHRHPLEISFRELMSSLHPFLLKEMQVSQTTYPAFLAAFLYKRLESSSESTSIKSCANCALWWTQEIARLDARPKLKNKWLTNYQLMISFRLLVYLTFRNHLFSYWTFNLSALIIVLQCASHCTSSLLCIRVIYMLSQESFNDPG